MGIDTRYWGPSAWQLFHYISFHAKNPQQFLLGIKDILPCRFCRESTSLFAKELPNMSDSAKWVYDLHNKVNHKLRTQCKDNPSVINPGDDPSFEEVRQKYESMKLTKVLGRDFLFSIAANYPKNPTEQDIVTQKTFLNQLAEVYPKNFTKYLENHSAELESRNSYMKWMYGLFKYLKSNSEIPTFQGYAQRLAYYTSGCDKKTYKGKTCRRIKGGGRTKTRDHRKTKRVAYSSII